MSDFARRDFLKVTGALAATATLGGLAAGAERKDRGFKKAVKYSMVGGNAPLLEKFKMLKEIGYDGIDMDRPADHQEVLAARSRVRTTMADHATCRSA